MTSGEKMNRNIDTVLGEVVANPKVREMKKFIQHGRVTTYDHCESVARLCYEINERFSLGCDLKVLLWGAMLHDFYLYDWHEKDGGTHRLHGYRHAERACRNARKYFHVGSSILQVIYCHMWPLNITRIPRSREAWVVCIADKCVSLQETVRRR